MTPSNTRWIAAAGLALALVVGAVTAGAQPCPDPSGNCGNVALPDTFPRIQLRAFAGLVGSAGQDSTVARRVTLEWHRDLALEQRLRADTLGGGFGGYNVYRVFTEPDTCRLELVRRFVYKDSLLWHFPDDEEIIRFVDPDSAGNLVKICRPDPVDPRITCPHPGDSVFVLMPPPPPPNGFPIYYTVTYAADPSLSRNSFEDKFVPDLTHCTNPSDPRTCCNMNNKALNLLSAPVFTTSPTTSDLENIFVVPNPYRGNAPWDPAGTNRIEFRNLPPVARIEILTVAGDRVRDIEHNNPLSGTASWDLKNADGRDVTAGIYMYRVTTPQGFELRDHFVIIR